ncbi:MAG TPA: penicillin-binding protein 2, partial [Tepidisphaeraceae bacterium]|nr:penicillin-binding protein 2 [Tepidisphaeraceae bacterium]
MFSPSFSMFRAGGLLGGVVTLFLALCCRVAYLETYGRQDTIIRAERQQNESVILPARRGDFFDRNGIILAGTVQTEALFVDPKFFFQQLQLHGETMTQIDGDISQLANYTDMDAASLQKLMHDRAASRFIKVGEDLDADAVAQVRHLGLPGVGVVPVSQRVYPLGSIACHILGGVGADGSGIEGLELKFDKILAGRDGAEYLTKDADRRPIGVAADDYLPPRHGQHIVLTIDVNIQMMTEEELAATCTQFQAARGEAVVMDPHTGAILALANWLKDYPSFNPANLGDSPPEARLDAAVALPYEPGSTIKPFIAGPALMWGVTNPGEVWPIHGGVHIFPDGRHVRDVEAYPPLTMWDALVKSSNICMSMLGERLGNARLHEALSSFGFGRDTGVELPGEDPGLLNPLSKWTRFS